MDEAEFVRLARETIVDLKIEIVQEARSMVKSDTFNTQAPHFDRIKRLVRIIEKIEKEIA